MPIDEKIQDKRIFSVEENTRHLIKFLQWGLIVREKQALSLKAITFEARLKWTSKDLVGIPSQVRSFQHFQQLSRGADNDLLGGR